MSRDIVLMILVMTAATYGARVLPLVLLRNKEMKGIFKSFVQLVPVALLAALVIPEFFISSDNSLTLLNPFLLTGLLTFLFAKKVPNLFLSVLFGMIVYWGFDKII